VDEELFAPRRRNERMRARLTGGELDKPLVLYAGRLAAEKRLIDLCDAAAMLPGVRFAFIGDGPQRDALERRNHQMRAVFTGYLRGLPLAEAFACADVFAFPSDTDTFGQVVLQAMASGVPPVVVAGSAPAQLVPEGIAGLHVPARDPRALANAIRWLTAHPDAHDEMGSAARKHALGYSWDTLVDRLEVLLFQDAPVATTWTPGETVMAPTSAGITPPLGPSRGP
jgi:glycosyltransferase involved in cell wall biosynthesis